MAIHVLRVAFLYGTMHKSLSYYAVFPHFGQNEMRFTECSMVGTVEGAWEGVKVMPHIIWQLFIRGVSICHNVHQLSNLHDRLYSTVALAHWTIV